MKLISIFEQHIIIHFEVFMADVPQMIVYRVATLYRVISVF